MDHLLYGVAYYDEYMPCERLEQDVQMMLDAGINVVRIAESTWSTWEPHNGVFDFTHLDRVLDAMERAGISVIIGTPTYAFPAWLAKEHPEILAQTKNGQERYGRRQNMDITHPSYRFYGERIIRKLMERTANRAGVIGFQLDNETKHYDVGNPHVQRLFVEYLKKQFAIVEEMNEEFGLAYWSNAIHAWEDFPDVLGTINGSLGAEFEKFQRTLVTEFLAWQAGIVREYAREDQFVTHNFDYEWRGYSFGVQPHVDHAQASKCLDIAGCDIYHPTQEHLTGVEISFGGDLIRSLKHQNYYVLETQAQGFPQWTPYPGQLRLQAFSHVASGADMVEYWHWHSIHNSFETYWKGLVSHDFGENATYQEAKQIGREFAQLSERLVHLKKQNRAAILVSNEALTALNWFPMMPKASYNDVVRWCYDALYKMNVGCDVIFAEEEDFGQYDLLVVPALYAASEELLKRLEEYVRQGGQLVMTFKSGFANEHVKVYHDTQPHGLTACCGVRYDQFTLPEKTSLDGFALPEEVLKLHDWMELLTPQGAEVWATYCHPQWSRYAAVTHNRFGKGSATYVGCFASEEVLQDIFRRVFAQAEIELEVKDLQFPIIVKSGVNQQGKRVVFYFNYSGEAQKVTYRHGMGTNLFTGDSVLKGSSVEIASWDFLLVEEA